MNRNRDGGGVSEEVENVPQPLFDEYRVRNEACSMMLSKLLEGVTVAKMFQTMYGQMVVTHDVEVHGIQYDSRKIERGDLFVALRGSVQDGHRYIAGAVERGAKVAVLEDDQAMPDSYFMHAGVIKVVVPDSRIALARLSAAFYGNPSLGLELVGVTGTNGKTTTVSNRYSNRGDRRPGSSEPSSMPSVTGSCRRRTQRRNRSS